MSGLPTIVSIKVISYESKNVPIDILASYLIGLHCTREGDLTLSLIGDWKIKQKGSLIKPPIRWIKSFEKTDTFEVICRVVKNDVPYMPGKRVSTEYNIDEESIILLRDNTENIECIP